MMKIQSGDWLRQATRFNDPWPVRRNGKLSLAVMIGDSRTRLRCRQAHRAIGEGYLYAEFIVLGRLTQLLVFPALHE